MEALFKFRTEYNRKSIAVMVKALRKTVRKKQTTRTYAFSVIVILFALLLVFSGDSGFVPDARSIFTLVVVLILLVTLVFQDQLNALIAQKRAIPGVASTTVTFREDGYYTETAVGNTEWGYGKITALAETKDFFVFLIGKNHGQVYDKSAIEGGTVDEFRTFIEEKMNMKTVYIK